MPVPMEDNILNCDKIKSCIDTIAKKPKLGVNYFLLLDDKKFILNGKKLKLLPMIYHNLLTREDFMVYVDPQARKVSYYAWDIEDMMEHTKCNEVEGEMEWANVEMPICSFLIQHMKELTSDPFPYKTSSIIEKSSATDDTDDYESIYSIGGWNTNRDTKPSFDWNAASKEREAFHEKYGALLKVGRVSMAVDVISDEITRMCEEKKFESLDTILNLIDFGKLNIPLMFSFLDATKEYKDKLHNRKDFIGKVKTHLAKFDPSKIDLFLWELEAA